MTLRERIKKRFKQLGLRYVRAPESEAEALAESVSWSHDRLGAFSTFCLHPASRTQDLNRAIVVRWLETIPVLVPSVGILGRKSIPPGAYVNFSSETLEGVYSTASEIAKSAMALPEPEALHFANCLMLSASPAFSFYQRCMACEEHTLEVLAQSFVAYAGAFPHAAAAYQLCLSRRAEG